MPLGNIVFIKGQGGLGRPLAGSDYISGLLFYTANANLPGNFTTSNRYITLFSAGQAQSVAGILPNFNTNNIYADANFTDATAATWTSVITMGATGDQLNVQVSLLTVGGTAVTVSLGTYTQLSGDSTLALLGASLAAYINNTGGGGTISHGITATFNTATLTLTFPKSQGVFANTGTLVVMTTVVGTFAGAEPALGVSGTQSLQAIWNYHISEYFRLQPKGQLTVGFNAIGGLATYTFTEITVMQKFTNGAIRQAGIYLGGDSHAYTSGDLTAINSEIVANDDGVHMPLSVWYGANVQATADLTALTNLNTLSANKASVTLGQDGANFGAFLFATAGYSITDVGAKLGATALASVSTSITWVANFNMTNGAELSVPAFANGQLVNAQPQSYLVALDSLGYNYLLNYIDNAGTYNSDSRTAISANSDYAYLEDNRTIDKACRGIYQSMLPAIGAPIILNADGTLTDVSIAYFTSLCEGGLIGMYQNQELSGDPSSGNIPLGTVVISPTQNVLSTGNLVVSVNLIPIGVARTITVNIEFVTSLSSSS